MMHKFHILFLVVILFTACEIKQGNKAALNKKEDAEGVDPLKPVMLDDIHYYTMDRTACNKYFEELFDTRPMMEESDNPFQFIDFQQIDKKQSTINISKPGPFPGIKVGDPKRWERPLEKPSPDNAPRYGVHWLGLSTSNLGESIQRLEAKDIQIIDKRFKSPFDGKEGVLCYGPDYNLIFITQDDDASIGLKYKIDHLLLLVNSLSENTRFFMDVFAGQVNLTHNDYTIMDIGEHKFILTTPKGLGLKAEDVIQRDPKIFRPDIDHLGFLYKQIEPSYSAAVEKGYKFLMAPNRIVYFGKPTLYTFSIIYSPDGLQCEMYQEDGRHGPRTKYK